MMPQTVPNRPTKGAVAPIVASRPVPCAMPLPARASILESSIASRSLTPSADRPSERLSSIVASSTRSATGPFRVQPDWGSRAAVRRLLAFRSLRVAARARRFAQTSSKPLASQTVQVTTDANARPIMTIFTTMSAFRNIDHGDRSLGNEPIV
jgi:hypothetical protein